MEYRYLGKERLKVSAGWFEKLLKPDGPTTSSTHPIRG